MKYDVAVIGGGPAGMMAAGRAGERGLRVILVEKNSQLGVKLLSTGGTRCNITNKAESIRAMVGDMGKNGKFLFSALNRFGPLNMIEFLEKMGVKTKIEENNRVFPISNNSVDVLNAMIRYLKESNVCIKTNSSVKKIIKKDQKIEKILLSNGEEVLAKKYIISTGGKSYPSTGSTGDGYRWLDNIGHTITKLSPALAPVIVADSFVGGIEGVGVSGVGVNLYNNNKKIKSEVGDILFTSNGITGPLVINMSRDIAGVAGDSIRIEVDFFPDIDFGDLDKKILSLFKDNNNKMFRNSLDGFLPRKIILVAIRLSGVSPDKKVNLITSKERKSFLKIVKRFVFTVSGLDNYNNAFITSGGVDLSEVNPTTMGSRLVKNLYLAGEILDVDGPTGGYNLQICWSTGYLAGDNS